MDYWQIFHNVDCNRPPRQHESYEPIITQIIVRYKQRNAKILNHISLLLYCIFPFQIMNFILFITIYLQNTSDCLKSIGIVFSYIFHLVLSIIIILHWLYHFPSLSLSLPPSSLPPSFPPFFSFFFFLLSFSRWIDRQVGR